jgi:hypothetical protein
MPLTLSKEPAPAGAIRRVGAGLQQARVGQPAQVRFAAAPLEWIRRAGPPDAVLRLAPRLRAPLLAAAGGRCSRRRLRRRRRPACPHWNSRSRSRSRRTRSRSRCQPTRPAAGPPGPRRRRPPPAVQPRPARRCSARRRPCRARRLRPCPAPAAPRASGGRRSGKRSVH